MLPPMALLGVLVMMDEAKLLWKHAMAAFCCYAATSYLGAKIAYLFNGRVLGLLFSVHMLLLALLAIGEHCQSADALSQSLLKHLLKVEGGAAE